MTEPGVFVDLPDGRSFEFIFGTLPDKRTFVVVEYDKEGTPTGASVESVDYLLTLGLAREELKRLEQLDQTIT